MELPELALPDERCGVGFGTVLDESRHGLGTGRIRQGGQLVEVVLTHAAAHAHQDGAFPYRRAPGIRKRRLEDGLIGEPASFGHARARTMRSMASSRRSSATVSDSRT